ncbi:MAG: hypothetical protein CSA50_04045 [Gammaproteobacteria bacterium]|nr:MAG: hypothetical protein CSA50_04045 [Gammaproteobacteria bacterium]
MNPISHPTETKKPLAKIFSIRLVLIVLLVYCPAPCASEAPSLEWRQLNYKGSKLFITLESHVTRKTITQQEALKELIPVRGQTVKLPMAPEVLKTRVHTSVMGHESTFTLWQNPDLGVLQRNSLYTGLKNWFRTYRHLDTGVYSIKIKPESGENDQPWQSWSKRSENLYSIPKKAQEIVLSESEAIFDLIAQGQLQKPGDRTELFIYDRDDIIRAILEVQSKESISVKYRITQDGQESSVEITINALKTSLTTTSYLDNKASSDFKFLGYKNNIKLYIDPRRNIALRLSGKVDYVGDVVIDLQSVVY